MNALLGKLKLPQKPLIVDVIAVTGVGLPFVLDLGSAGGGIVVTRPEHRGLALSGDNGIDDRYRQEF